MQETQILQEIRRMRFMEAYEGWQERRLSQKEAAIILGVHERNIILNPPPNFIIS